MFAPGDPYQREEILAPGGIFLATNRAAYGLSSLKVDTFSKGSGDSATSDLADPRSVTAGELGGGGAF